MIEMVRHPFRPGITDTTVRSKYKFNLIQPTYSYTKYEQFNPREYVAIDVESTGVDVWGHRLVSGVMCDDMPFSVSMCDEDGNGWYCEWPVDPYTRKVKPNFADIYFIQKTINGLGCIFHNSKFDCRMLMKIGINVPELATSIEDTLFMGRVFYTLEFGYGLKELAKKYLGIENKDEEALITIVNQARARARRYNTQAKKNGLPLITLGEDKFEDYWLPGYFAQDAIKDGAEDHEWLDLNGEYCRKDTYRTMGLYHFYTQKMYEDPVLRATYEKEIRKVWRLVNSMEEVGLRVYPETLEEEDVKCIEAMEEHKANMDRMITELDLKPHRHDQIVPSLTKTGKISKAWKPPEFNPGSPDQLKRILYLSKEAGGLGIPAQYARKGARKGTPENIAAGTASLTTDKDTLKELMYEPFVRELIGWRGASHTKTLFFDSMLGTEKVDPTPWREGKGRIKSELDHNGRRCYFVHPGFNQCGTKTGRFSAGGDMGFNPQQATAGGKKSLGGGRFSSQKVFGPREGYYWLGFDYSQQEGRIFADIAQIPLMLNALYKGEDLFEAMANGAWGGKDNRQSIKAGVMALELFKDTPSDCSKCEGHGRDRTTKKICSLCSGCGSAVQHYWNLVGWSSNAAKATRPDSQKVYDVVQGWLAEYNYDIVEAEKALGKEASRQRCKHITYAKIFGGGPGSYTHLLMCSLADAKVFNDQYDSSMPEMKKYMNVLAESVKAKDTSGYSRGYIFNLYDRKLRVDPSFAYRAVSYMIQGTAADMMKESLIKVNDYLEECGLDAKLILTVHDELKIEILKQDFSPAFAWDIAKLMMDNDGRLDVPMPVGLSVCEDRWSINEVEYKFSDKGEMIAKKS